MRLAIYDALGLCYDGSTLEKRGIGGSESAVISMARELVKIGFDVTVFNDCDHDDAQPGVYDGVSYVPRQLINNDPFDVFISSRSITPFATKLEAAVRSTHRILWMHDTFCEGDEHLQMMCQLGVIHKVYTLSDFHTSYVGNCDHGHKRMFEILKPYIFQTRNGINRWVDWVDVAAKDPNLFVYNASVTKGMVPLVEDIWPKIKSMIPTAKLKIIGGYYRFREDHGPDQQELKHRELKQLAGEYDIHFTDIVSQREIAQILSEASFTIYPTAFPETFGISTLESLAYNTPMITTRFGALEETAIDLASWKLDGPVEPNSLFPYFDKAHQINRFASMAVGAYHDRYLWQQKAYACNAVKDISTWDTVALQWKQQIYKDMRFFLPVEEYRAVTDINNKVKRVFDRRFDQITTTRKMHEKSIHVVVPVFNGEQYITTCIHSIAQQDYDNYKVTIIDDASTDQTQESIDYALGRLSDELASKFEVVSNKHNMGAVYNQYNTMLGTDSEIIMLIDGDDWLVNNPHVFDHYNCLYHEGAQFTYGSCWSLADNIPLIAQPYPPEVLQAKTYRDHKFNWNMPYTHLRTWRQDLVPKIERSSLCDEHGQFYKAGGDGALFYSVLEQADPDKVVVVSEPMYVYNDTNPLNDYKINGTEQTANANKILSNDKMIKPANKKILIAIPTAKYIEPETMKSVYDLIVPEGYTTEFQFFYGYRVDQIRNLIADWVVKGYDYLLSIDSDVTFARDTLVKMLRADKSIITGVYRQRLEPPTYEVYSLDGRNMTEHQIFADASLKQIGGCGFGCVLVNRQVFVDVGYPQFEYHHALSHSDTISEDTDFCNKAIAVGHSIWVDPTILVNHKGEKWFEPNSTPQIVAPVLDPIQEHHRQLRSMDLLPQEFKQSISNMKDQFRVQPKVIYDIGASVLHWTDYAKTIWPSAQYILFDGMDTFAHLYKTTGDRYFISVLSDADNKEVSFWQNEHHPGGNSYYRESTRYSPSADQLFNESNVVVKSTNTLDTLVRKQGLPQPDLVKIDVQGAELDVLRGAVDTLEGCRYVIVEAQHVEYNTGAPSKEQVFEFLERQGFRYFTTMSFHEVDGNYLFVNSRLSV